MATRPELATLQQQERDAEDASAPRAGQRALYGPTLSAIARGATYAGAEQSSISFVPNWSVEGLLSWPIYQGGLTRGQVHQAEATLQSIDAQRGLEELQVQLDVDSARLAVRAAKATIDASDDALTNAREQLHFAEQRYATGVGSIIELNDALVATPPSAAQVIQAAVCCSPSGPRAAPRRPGTNMMNDQRIATRPSAAPPVEADRPRRSLRRARRPPGDRRRRRRRDGADLPPSPEGGGGQYQAARRPRERRGQSGRSRCSPDGQGRAARRLPVWLDGDIGNVSAFYTVTVKSQVDGRIDKVLFTEGQHVKKGDVIIQIDPRPFAIQLESAQAALQRDNANLKNAHVNLDRYKTLSDQNLIAVQQYTDQQSTVDQQQAQVRADQSQIDSARLNLDYARIISPIDGVTGVRLVDPGNIVHASDQTGLVVVTQLDPIAVFFTLPEDDLPAIQEAMAAGELGVQALSRSGDKPLGDGKLSVIDNEINQATATGIRLKAIFPNPGSLLWPNQFVKARLRLSTRKNAIVVPAAVVQHGPQGTFAYVVAADSTAAVRPVTVEAIQGEVAIISNGLQVGEQVVTDGQAQLRPGTKVAAKPAPQNGGKSDDGSPTTKPADSAGSGGAPGSPAGAGDKP